MIEEITPDNPDEPFANAILPRRIRYNSFRLDSYVLQEFLKHPIFEGLPVVVKQIFRLMAEGGSIADLLNQPLRSRMLGNGDVFDLASAMRNDQKNVQGLEGDGRYDREIHGPEITCMIVEERFPGLLLLRSGGLAGDVNIFRDCVRCGRIGNVQRDKALMDFLGGQRRVFFVDALDQSNCGRRDFWSSTFGLASPEELEGFLMPA